MKSTRRLGMLTLALGLTGGVCCGLGASQSLMPYALLEDDPLPAPGAASSPQQLALTVPVVGPDDPNQVQVTGKGRFTVVLPGQAANALYYVRGVDAAGGMVWLDQFVETAADGALRFNFFANGLTDVSWVRAEVRAGPPVIAPPPVVVPPPPPVVPPDPTPIPVPVPVPVPAPIGASKWSLQVSAERCYAGSALKVLWYAPKGEHTNDRVGLYRKGALNPDSLLLLAPGPGSGAGTGAGGALSFTAPSAPGGYEFRYVYLYQRAGVTRTDYTKRASSAGVKVLAAPDDYSLLPQVSRCAVGATVAVEWTAPAGRTPKDWISLYPILTVPAGRSSGIDLRQFVDGSQRGLMHFTAPSAAGNVEWRYYTSGTPGAMTVSVPVQVQ